MGIDTPKPRQQILTDLAAFISPHVQDGHEILLLMDANSKIDDPSMSNFLHDSHLHDIMSEYLPDVPPNTYQRGRHKIDHILGTMGFLLAVTDAGILPFTAGPKSDHAILYVDFSLETLNGIPSQSLHDPTHPAARNLWSTDIKAAEKYIEYVQHGFHAENILERISILIYRSQRTNRCTDDDARILHKIDSDITAILLDSERKY
jgi:hypothetical protein